jgi:Zn-dependent protease with chaperone function
MSFGPSLLLLCTAASAVIAFSMSAVVGAGLALFRRKLTRLTPAAEARVLFSAALLPMLASAALMTAALAPSFGWIADHCSPAGDLHAHPHICVDHHVAGLPAGPLLALAGLLLARLAASAARFLHGAVKAARTSHRLARVAHKARDGRLRVLPLDEPQAFVVGTFRPAVFVTRGLVSEAHREHLAPALSHELAHVRRRDPLRRAVAVPALAFHLPGLATWIERRMARAQEMAADADAAEEMQSPERVARALVRLTRAQSAAPRLALAFGRSDVEVRVTALLDDRPRHDRPRGTVLVAGVFILFAAAGTSADAVHHSLEIVLGLIGG